MKSPSHPSAKRQKARVMWACRADLIEHKGTPDMPLECVEAKSRFGHEQPVLVLPMPSLKAAQKRKRIENMSEEVLVKLLMSFDFPYCGNTTMALGERTARALLRVIKGEA